MKGTEIILIIVVLAVLLKRGTPLGFCYNKTLKSGTVEGMSISNKIKSLDDSNRLDCTRDCAYSEECISFFVNGKEGKCILYSRPIADMLLRNEDDWEGFDFEDTSRVTAPEEQPTELWIDSVSDFQSEFAPSNTAVTIIGPPRVYPAHGDLPGAWTSRNWSQGPRWIMVKIIQRLFMTRIDIYETFNPGGTKDVFAKKPNGVWDLLWTTPQLIKLTTSRINSIDVQPSYPSDELQIVIDGVAAQYWVEIDAVKVIGFPD